MGSRLNRVATVVFGPVMIGAVVDRRGGRWVVTGPCREHDSSAFESVRPLEIGFRKGYDLTSLGSAYDPTQQEYIYTYALGPTTGLRVLLIHGEGEYPVRLRTGPARVQKLFHDRYELIRDLNPGSVRTVQNLENTVQELVGYGVLGEVGGE